MGVKRTMRVGPLIYEEISQILVRKLEDPRLKGVIFTRVAMTADLKIARVYFSMIGGPDEIEAAAAALEKAQGVFKRGISRNLHLRYMPEFEFHHDRNLDYADKIEQIIQEIHRGEGDDDGGVQDGPGD